MEAEPDFSPAPAEPKRDPTLSPETENPHHDKRNLKADMMLALGESVSFGRFLAEPLEWVKWSAFSHNRYLEEAAVHARPGSVAQKKAFFEAHYAKRKRKSDDLDPADHDDGGFEAMEDVGAPSWSSSAVEPSCMTDESPAPGEEVCGGCDAGVVDCGGGSSDEPGHVPDDLRAITDVAEHSCVMDVTANEMCHSDGSGEQVSGAVMQSQEKHDLCTSNLIVVDAMAKQPLKDITDSVKKWRLQMSSLLSKPEKFRSPPSSKKGQSSSAKRQSLLHSAKENTSPPSTDSNKLGATSALKKRSTLTTFHMPKSIDRCVTVNAYSISINLGTTITERISQLESATRPTENTQPNECRPPKKKVFKALPEIAQKASQVDEQRSLHIMRVKEKLFGSTSPAVHQKTSITKGKEIKLNNEHGIKEFRHSFHFKVKQSKDSTQQIAEDIPSLLSNGHLPSDINKEDQTTKCLSKEKKICCFPIRRLY